MLSHHYSKPVDGALAEFQRLEKRYREAKKRLATQTKSVANLPDSRGAQRRKHDVISEPDLVLLTRRIVQIDDDPAYKMQARLLRWLFGTGMRITEALGVRYSDLRPLPHDRGLIVRIPSRKRHPELSEIETSNELAPRFVQWFDENRDRKEPDKWLFQKRRGSQYVTGFIDKPYTVRNIPEQHFRQIQLDAGIPEMNAEPSLWVLHEIRYTVLTFWVQSGRITLADAAKIAGHIDKNGDMCFKSMARYQRPRIGHIFDKSEAVNPLWWQILKGEAE